MKINEDVLKENIKRGELSRLYYFYGKELFLVKHYTDLVSEKIAPDTDDFNMVKINGLPDPEELGAAIDTLPVFAEKKLIFINDMDAEKADVSTLDKIIELLSDIPEYCAVIINITGLEPSLKNSKTKKLISCIEEYGTVCEFSLLTRPKAAQMIIKKAARAGCEISRADAEYLCDLCLGGLTMIGAEVEKLCAYAGNGGVITTEIIDSLVPRLTETRVYDIATALTSKNAKIAFYILDDLTNQGVDHIVILSALSGVFVDFYRARLGKNQRYSPDKTAKDFGYAKNLAWKMNKAGFDTEYVKRCIWALYKADIKLKSAPRDTDKRIIIEKTMAEILTIQ